QTLRRRQHPSVAGQHRRLIVCLRSKTLKNVAAMTLTWICFGRWRGTSKSPIVVRI
ncbi:hypothetical protein AVDCRST_MAG94-6481, partial [uncultured Leptolyngbya sp.]